MAFISIAGNIGVGKTTLANLISGELGFKLYEEIIDTPLLNKFYRDIENKERPSEISFLLQKYFLGIRVAAHTSMQESNQNSVQDRSIYEDRFVFAMHLNKQGYISDERFELYCKLFELQMKGLRHPNMLIYLTASPITLRGRIRKRGRPSESQLLDLNNLYLEQLAELYDEMIANYPGYVLKLDSESYNLDENIKDKKEVLGLIMGNLESLKSIEKDNL